MGLKKRTKTLSSISRALLAEGESERVDFKRSPQGINSDDLVAFANSETGGNILVGVDEQIVDSAQVGIVCGCDVDDASILQILNKAVSCVPPISVDVFVENLNAKPILRITIPASTTKPHCTPKGVYCRRDGSRNRPMHPAELLRVFLETESRAFAERFESAADRITDDLTNLESTLDTSIRNMADQLGWADMQLGDTESSISAILGLTRHLRSETDDISARLRTLFRQDEREDPVRNREMKAFIDALVEQLCEQPDLLKQIAEGGSLQINTQGKTAIELTKDEVSKALTDAVSIAKKQEDMKKYDVFIKTSHECTEEELDSFATLVREGGEVIEGVRARVENAFRLGFVTYDGVIVGTAALKKPISTYRNKVFSKSKSELSPKAYPFELGWIYLRPDHRKRGQMNRLLDKLLSLAGEKGIFSTTRSNNEIMEEILHERGFRTDGEVYPSTQNPELTIKLFIIDAEKPPTKSAA